MGAGDTGRFTDIFKEMKIALCLSGIAGGTTGKGGKGETVNPEIAFKLFGEHILKRNNVDIFFHSWSLDCGDKLVKLYDPARYILEPQITFSDDPYTHRAHSRWYSTQKSIGLVNDRYDFILLSRFDVAFFTDIDYRKYDPGYFYASHWNDTGNRENHREGFLDFWFFGGADIMIAVSYTHLTLPTILLV